MFMLKKYLKRLLSFKISRMIKICPVITVIAILMMNSAVITYASASSSALNLNKDGSITITLADSDGNTVSGGYIGLYKVATLYLNDGDMKYKLTDSFSNFDYELNVTDTSLPSQLLNYAHDNGVSGTSDSVSSNGTVVFKNLDLGLYLVAQSTSSDNYVAINPFVVTVPIDEDDEWNYNVNAYPKVGTITEITDTSSSSPTPDGGSSSSSGSGGGGGGGHSYYPEGSSATVDEDDSQTQSSEDSDSDSDTDTGEQVDPDSSSGDIGSDEPTEVPSDTSHDDPTEPDASTVTSSNTPTDDNNNGTDSISSSSRIRTMTQTGQLNWPIPVFCMCGFIFILGGIITLMSDKKVDNR